ncbi:MAG: helix-hairpin-helix domain-containing protein [Candidatus Cohnella colombiensis]|uniref:Helix-hairpin-helix domain-containing protein n=1 Tax=Candidatus Cohnella colombiensis TaxID=3121368 RepID=A0AA95JEC1_9BACL|nr:MAG: helix-hairpin-helix domain-containing protein [Cohnella sp.]
MSKRNFIGVIGLIGVGMILIIYSLFFTRSNDAIPGWEPVAAQLKLTLESLHPERPVDQGNLNSSSTPTPSEIVKAPAPVVVSNEPLYDGGNVSSTQLPNVPVPVSEANEVEAHLVNLNSATQAQLEDLPGIGAAKAKAIIAYRELHQGFRAVNELLKVKGIGPKIYEKLSSLVKI